MKTFLFSFLTLILLSSCTSDHTYVVLYKKGGVKQKMSVRANCEPAAKEEFLLRTYTDTSLIVIDAIVRSRH